jgi:hypothetical protein
VFGQLISSTPSMVEIAQPRSRLVPNVPSLSLRSLNTGIGLAAILLQPRLHVHHHRSFPQAPRRSDRERRDPSRNSLLKASGPLTRFTSL